MLFYQLWLVVGFTLTYTWSNFFFNNNNNKQQIVKGQTLNPSKIGIMILC